MDQSEKLVERYLTHLGYSDVLYEPDGNVPPDFLLNGRIAVEVRRLNQNETTPSGSRGLEEVAIPLKTQLRRLIESLGPPTNDTSWFVSYGYRRPLPPWKELHGALRDTLLEFKGRRTHGPERISVAHAITVRIDKASEIHSTFFVLGGYMDQDAGGFLQAEIKRNLEICVAEKTRKIAQVRSRYPEWWLVLVDRIGYGLSNFDQTRLKELVCFEHSWDKIVLVNPENPRCGFEL